MDLPELALQTIYARLAWGIVLATLLLALWPRRFALTRAAAAVVLLCTIALQALPGGAAPAYWLGLAFELPSCLLVGLCVARLWLVGPGAAASEAARKVLPPRLALTVAALGALLYLDAMGLISIGLYYWGFGPKAAPLVALLIAAASAAAIYLGKARPQAGALLLAALGFSLLRLPTGNIWDALLDPLLWGWALAVLARTGWRRTPAPAHEQYEHKGVSL